MAGSFVDGTRGKTALVRSGGAERGDPLQGRCGARGTTVPADTSAHGRPCLLSGAAESLLGELTVSWLIGAGEKARQFLAGDVRLPGTQPRRDRGVGNLSTQRCDLDADVLDVLIGEVLDTGRGQALRDQKPVDRPQTDRGQRDQRRIGVVTTRELGQLSQLVGVMGLVEPYRTEQFQGVQQSGHISAPQALLGVTGEVVDDTPEPAVDGFTSFTVEQLHRNRVATGGVEQLPQDLQRLGEGEPEQRRGAENVATAGMLAKLTERLERAAPQFDGPIE